jgi:outer membrane protein assembly factor BamA
MQWRFTQVSCLVVACVVGHPVTQAQHAASPITPVAQATLGCPPPILFHNNQTANPELVIADLAFEGNPQMAMADQNQIMSALQQRRYSGDLDGVTSELQERVRQAWQERGYFKVQVHGNARILTRAPLENRIAVAFQVDEGQQYRLREITFKNNRALSNVQALRDLFDIKDGDMFNVAQVSKSLERLTDAYGQIGYVNFSSIPDTRIDEDGRTISLDVDLDEGKQFYVSSINVTGLDEHGPRDIMKEFLLKPGDVYNQRLLELSTKRLSAPESGMWARCQVQQDETAAAVAITISFLRCSAQ